jgi:hypothetical protein
MNPNRLIPIILLPAACVGCQSPASSSPRKEPPPGHARPKGRLSLTTIHAPDSNAYRCVGAIPVPEGYVRVPAAEHSFAAWLRTVPLKKDKTVYLYNGEPKRNQEAQFAVLDISVNDPSIRPGQSEGAAAPKDLQQCADAIMRLRAEYLYEQKDFVHIEFRSSQGTRFNFSEWLNGKRYRLSAGKLVDCAGRRGPRADAGAAGANAGNVDANAAKMRKSFGEFMEIVFTYCGSLSLERQMIAGGGPEKMEIGDVLIHGGSPGHVMLIIDMAVDSRSGRKVYLLAQGYMPAQDIHIVRDLYDGQLNPWYPDDGRTVDTPEYTFYAGEMRAWPR